MNYNNQLILQNMKRNCVYMKYKIKLDQLQTNCAYVLSFFLKLINLFI